MVKWLMLVVFPMWMVAQSPKTRILFLLDASYSMNKNWTGGTRWQAAMQTMIEITDSLASLPNVEFAVRVYGHQFSLRDNNCKDSRLEMAFGNVNSNSIRRKLASIVPNGVTPLAYSLEKCANDFAATGEVSRNFLIIITDGEESCGGDPCAVTQKLQQNNILLKPIVLGIQLPDVLQQQFSCIGELTNTASGAELNQALKKAVGETISKTTFQLNILDAAGKPTETDVAFTLTDSKTGVDKYHFHHTLNARGLPDTITISPLFTYDIQVHSTPPVFVKGISMKRNEHNIVSVDAPQGVLEVQFAGSVPKHSSVEKIKCLVQLPSNSTTYFWLQPGSKRKVITGNYVVEVLTNPAIAAARLTVDERKTTTVVIPAPGLVTFSRTYELYGAVFLKSKEGLQKVYDFNEMQKQEVIALQPGKYVAIYRSKFAQTMHTTVEKEFEVVGGSSVLIRQ